MSEFKGRMLKAEGGFDSSRSRRAPNAFLLLPSSFRGSSFRLGVTLIELLVTITIIATLSATFLGVSRLAMESAREAKTKTTISKIDGLLMEKWNEYTTRRVDIDQGVLANLRQIIFDPNSSPVAFNQRRRAFGAARTDLQLLATRELMKLEMPDRWSDIGVFPEPQGVIADANFNPSVLDAFPALARTYRRAGDRVLQLGNSGKLLENQSAECLYLIVMNATGDGEARTLFSEQNIGDTDDDGALEFLDGWGRPISFIRWPAGFVSPLQPIDTATGNRLVDSDHDPFDFFRRDLRSVIRNNNNTLEADQYPNSAQGSALGDLAIRQAIDAMESEASRPASQPNGNRPGAYRLLPLIYSSGPDGIFDLVFPDEYVTGLDPYDSNTGVDMAQVGQVNLFDGDGDNSLDNIHNHLQDGN